MSDVLRVSAVRKEVPVVMAGLDGQDHAYTLVELYGDERDVYLNQLLNRTKTGPDGKVTGTPDVRDIQAGLVSKCLHDEARVLVKIDAVRKFPASTLDALFRACEDLNALTEEARERVKKASGPTTSTGFE